MVTFYSFNLKNKENGEEFLENIKLENNPSQLNNIKSTNSLFSPQTCLHPKMIKLYFIDIPSNKNHESLFFIFSNKDDIKNHFQNYNINIYKILVFDKWVSGFNIKMKNLTNISNIKLFTGVPENIWFFSDNLKIKKYTLAAVIWPPARNISDLIINDIKVSYEVKKNIKIKLNNKHFLPFIKKVYRGDRRCDKSQLPYKARIMKRRELEITYLKFMVDELDLDTDRVSNTALKIKKIIRNKYKKMVSNYEHDIIIHISDNCSHSFDMEKTVKSLIENKKKINNN